ncbi:MAG: AsnC family transcriptional regulator [archaeon]
MLDNIDLKIIQKLTKDGRLSLTELSEGMDISRVSVASRIEKLTNAGLLQVSACVNLNKLNFQTLIVELQVEQSKIQTFKKIIENEPRVVNSFEISGQFNFMLVCAAKSNEMLRHFVENELKKFSSDCKVTLSSNPLAPVRMKEIGEI